MRSPPGRPSAAIRFSLFCFRRRYPGSSSSVRAGRANAASSACFTTNRNHRYRCGQRRLDGHRVPASRARTFAWKPLPSSTAWPTCRQADETFCVCSNWPAAAMSPFFSAGKLRFRETRSSPPNGAATSDELPGVTLPEQRRAVESQSAAEYLVQEAGRCRASRAGPRAGPVDESCGGIYARSARGARRFASW